MLYTQDIHVLRNQIVLNVPSLDEELDCDTRLVFMYLQDLTHMIDFYILGYDPKCDTILALVDPLFDSTYCMVEEAALSSFVDHHVYFKVYKRSQRIHYSLIKEMLMNPKN